MAAIQETMLHPTGDVGCQGTAPCHLCGAVEWHEKDGLPLAELLAIVFVRGGVDTDIRVCDFHRDQLVEHGKLAGRTFTFCTGEKKAS